jgi:hypothetical protein
MTRGYFQTLTKEERQLIGQKGGQTRRSKLVQTAWDKKDFYIRSYNDGSSIKELAIFAKINERTMARIVRGK